jgi:quercetin dioxygenase-like cupin family protein
MSRDGDADRALALDEAMERIMNDPEAATPDLDPRLAALLRIAGELRGLPTLGFKTRLEADQLARAEAITRGELVAHDLEAALRALPAERTFRFFASLDRWTLGVSRLSERSHWERHPSGDELLHVLGGELEITTLMPAGELHSTVRAGSLFLCPQGLWHRLLPRSPVTLLFATPGEGTEHSEADDPRRDAARDDALASRELPATHDVRAALHDLPTLVIDEHTTSEEADAGFRAFADLDGRTLGVMRFSGLTPWERHPGGDELLHVLEGEVELTVLTDDGPKQVNARAGSVFVCPRGLWHRQLPKPSVTILFGTPTATTEVSFADDPRLAGA